MDPNRYFEEHWREIEPERLDRYERMFAWRPEQEALIAPARIQAGQTVLEAGTRDASTSGPACWRSSWPTGWAPRATFMAST